MCGGWLLNNVVANVDFEGLIRDQRAPAKITARKERYLIWIISREMMLLYCFLSIIQLLPFFPGTKILCHFSPAMSGAVLSTRRHF